MKININQTRFIDNSKDVIHKDILTVNNEGIWEESERFKRDDGTPARQFNIHLKLKNGEVKSTALNYSNVKLLVTSFGDETVDWIGKEVRAWKTKSEKAKLGYIFVYVPIDWTRDETGEWLDESGQYVVVEQAEKKETVIQTEDSEEMAKNSPF